MTIHSDFQMVDQEGKGMEGDHFSVSCTYYRGLADQNRDFMSDYHPL